MRRKQKFKNKNTTRIVNEVIMIVERPRFRELYDLDRARKIVASFSGRPTAVCIYYYYYIPQRGKALWIPARIFTRPLLEARRRGFRVPLMSARRIRERTTTTASSSSSSSSFLRMKLKNRLPRGSSHAVIAVKKKTTKLLCPCAGMISFVYVRGERPTAGLEDALLKIALRGRAPLDFTAAAAVGIHVYIIEWKDHSLPDVGCIFRLEEIELLLSDSLCRPGGAKFIEFVARSGYADEPKRDEDGKPLLRRTTPLHRVPGYNYCVRQDSVRDLFKIYNRFDLNYADDSGLTHFHVACYAGCRDIVTEFLEAGQDPSCIWQETGDSALHLILKAGGCSRALAELLLRRGVDPNLANAEGLTSLHLICMTMYYEEDGVDMLFELNEELNQPFQLDVRDKLGNRPLHWALKCNNRMMAELLLIKGVDPNSSNAEGSTPLHVICDRRFDTGLAKLFFEINDRKNQTVQINAVDNKGRTPLQLAVNNILLNVVDLLLDRGADLSILTFSSASCLAQENNSYYLKLASASGILAIVERFEKSGYEVDQSAALLIMTFFAKHELLCSSMNFENYWHKNNTFTSKAKEIMVKPSLTLYDLLQLRPEKAAKLLTYTDYFEFAQWGNLSELPRRSQDSCTVFLCEKVSRGFFESWTMDSLMELTHYRLPLLCCDMIFEHLTNKDFYAICLAATDPIPTYDVSYFVNGLLPVKEK
ncbi:unnamed protein product [Trichogramma brassicae]|uniref:Peptidase A2 domain-containing protein n=1 Tax=Trichogramma brassicae TaxID=86971 RepID=A0A6H5I589_9HYME|nr:unnamed protein product [Trichogramma brassicae]